MATSASCAAGREQVVQPGRRARSPGPGRARCARDRDGANVPGAVAAATTQPDVRARVLVVGGHRRGRNSRPSMAGTARRGRRPRAWFILPVGGRGPRPRPSVGSPASGERHGGGTDGGARTRRQDVTSRAARRGAPPRGRPTEPDERRPPRRRRAVAAALHLERHASARSCSAAASLTPSLLPRGWVLQGLIAGITAAIGYGVGVDHRVVRRGADREPAVARASAAAPGRCWPWSGRLLGVVMLVARRGAGSARSTSSWAWTPPAGYTSVGDRRPGGAGVRALRRHRPLGSGASARWLDPAVRPHPAAARRPAARRRRGRRCW